MPSVSITLDFTAPQVVADPVGGNYQTLTSVDLVADEPSTIYYTFDGTDPVPGNPNTFEGPSPVTATLPSQIQVIVRFFARDLAGNDSPVSEEVYFIKPLNTTVRTRFGPIVKQSAIDQLATTADVTVTVDGVPATVIGIRPLHNEIFLDSAPPPGAEVLVNYCWFDNPTYTMLLNDQDYVTNAVFGQNATDVPYQLVLNCPVTPQPAEVTWEYSAFEREYTASLNSPDLLLLNEPVHLVREPTTGRPTRPDFVLNQSNTIFSYEQVKTDGQPTVLNEGTPIYPMTQDDLPTYGPATTLPASDFQNDPDLWKSFDVLVPDGSNILAFNFTNEAGEYICLETDNTAEGEFDLLTAACDRLTELEVEIRDPSDEYEFPFQNCGFIVANPTPQTSGQLNSCFVLNGGPFNQFHKQVTGTYSDQLESVITDSQTETSVSYEDVRSCMGGFILNDFTTLLNNFVNPGSYLNDQANAGGEYIPTSGSYLPDVLDCPNDEARILFTTGNISSSGSFVLQPFTNFFVLP